MVYSSVQPGLVNFQFPLHRDEVCDEVIKMEIETTQQPFSSLFIGMRSATQAGHGAALGRKITFSSLFIGMRSATLGPSPTIGNGLTFQFPLHRDEVCDISK